MDIFTHKLNLLHLQEKKSFTPFAKIKTISVKLWSMPPINKSLRLLILVTILGSSVSCLSETGGWKQRIKMENAPIERFTLKNKKGMEVEIIRYGASITQIYTLDRYGNFDDVILGFDSINDYKNPSNPFFGCVVGRYANRISNARYVLGEDTILLARKHIHSVHGGIKGFDKKTWEVESYTDSTLVLYYLSADGEEGFPGNLKTRVTYSILSSNELKIDYYATTDKPTPVNLTNHSYFNLSGKMDSTILNHELYLNSNYYTEVDDSMLPTGSILSVDGGAMDFTTSKRIGKDLFNLNNGYDHNWIINKSGGRLSLAAIAYDPLSGRGVEVRTTQPGIQFYTGNFLEDSIIGKNGTRYQKYAGFCLETQHYPDSPNQPAFPSTILYPDDIYYDTTILSFFTQ